MLYISPFWIEFCLQIGVCFRYFCHFTSSGPYAHPIFPLIVFLSGYQNSSLVPLLLALFHFSCSHLVYLVVNWYESLILCLKTLFSFPSHFVYENLSFFCCLLEYYSLILSMALWASLIRFLQEIFSFINHQSTSKFLI